MSLITRQERERLVLDLYNQGKTFREIAKEARMSFRDIGIILKKVVEEEKTEGSKEEEQQEVEHLSLPTQSYKLFSEGKTPLEVSIALNLGESETTKFYKEYWKLDQLDNLNRIYEEIKDDIGYFVKLYKLAKAKGIGVQQVVIALAITNNDLPAIEERFERIRNDVSMLQFQKHTCKRNLFKLNNQLATTTKLLNSLRMSCKRERREIKNLQNEKARLEAFITEFKNNNEDYLNKIKQTAEEKVKDVLTNDKLILKFATFSVIESLRSNSELYNFVIHDNSNNTTPINYGSNYPSLMLLGRQHQQQLFIDSYTALIIEEAEKFYNNLTTKLTNEAMAAAAAIRGSSLPLLPPSCNNNKQKLMYENDRYDETEEPRYNNNQS